MEKRFMFSKPNLFFAFAILIFSGCHDEPNLDPQSNLKELLIVSGNDYWTEVRSGTFESDSSRWLVRGSRAPNNAGISFSFYISIKKSALPQKNFPITLQSSDFSIWRTTYHDEPGGGNPITVKFDQNTVFTITNIEDDRVFGTFTASSSAGEMITGELLGIPRNFICPLNLGYTAPCPFDAGSFKVSIFSWTGGGEEIMALDPNSLTTIFAIFTLPVDTATLKDNFLLLENNTTPIRGRFQVKFFRVEFIPLQPLKPNTAYTARVRKGMRNTYNAKPLAEESALELKTACVPQELTDRIINNENQVVIGATPGITGTWTILHGEGGNFDDPTSSVTMFSGLDDETYNLRWTPNDGCPQGATEMMVSFVDPVNDFDGNAYGAVRIGDQVWMASNLNSSRDADGEVLNETVSSRNAGKGYPWYIAVNSQDSSSQNPSGIQGICPNGWHLPSKSEFQEMIDYLANDGRPIALLLRDKTQWGSSEIPFGLNAYGFNAISAGMQMSPGFWISGGAYFWTTTRIQASNNSYYYEITGTDQQILNGNIGYKMPVRCVRD